MSAVRCVIMQPTYLPWAGYFNLISQADHFVFLDDVQYERQSWQNRNRVLVDGRVHWLTVPAVREELGQPISAVEIDDNIRWRAKHARLIEQSYSKHDHIADAREILPMIIDPSRTKLADLNIAIISVVANRLGLAPSFHRSSELGISGPRSARLLRICERFGCDEYLSPVGANGYLERDRVFDGAAVRLRFQDFVPAEYAQRHAGAFIGYLSFIDVLANLGWRATREYARGRYRVTNGASA